MTENLTWGLDPKNAFLAERGSSYPLGEAAKAANDNFVNPYLALQQAQEQGYVSAGVQHRLETLMENPESLSSEQQFWVDTIQGGRDELGLGGKTSPLLSSSTSNQLPDLNAQKQVASSIPSSPVVGRLGSHGTPDEVAARKAAAAGLASAHLRERLSQPSAVAPHARLRGR